MTHLEVIRYAIVAYVLLAPWLFIYLQQSLYKLTFDDALGNKLIIRLHVISCLLSVCLFLATFDWGREIMR